MSLDTFTSLCMKLLSHVEKQVIAIPIDLQDVH